MYLLGVSARFESGWRGGGDFGLVLDNLVEVHLGKLKELVG